jgi:hypothetical protein
MENRDEKMEFFPENMPYPVVMIFTTGYPA